MAVSSATSWTDSTSVAAVSGACRVKAVRAHLAVAGAATVYIQLFDGTGTTPGVTAPTAVLPLMAVTGNKRKSFPFPGGMRFATGLEWVVTTTATGATAASGASAPLRVDIDYVLGG